jgi:prepilin peptidase CpaA
MLSGIVYSIILLAAAVGDVRTRRIPNKLVAILAVLGVAFAISQFPLLTGVGPGGGRVVVALLCSIPILAVGWVRAGDVKLYAAAGAWLGPMRALDGALVGALSGAVLSLIWMIRSHGVQDSVRTLGLAAGTPQVLTPGNAGKRSKLPYGVAIAAGALCAGWLPRLIFS